MGQIAKTHADPEKQVDDSAQERVAAGDKERVMEAKVILNRWDEHGRSVRIVVEYDGKEMDIVTVSQDTSLNDGSPQAATVNWGAIGSVTPRDAEAAALALLSAARIAPEMEAVKAWGRVTPPEPGMIWKGEGMPEISIDGGTAHVDSTGWGAKDAEGDEDIDRG